MWEASQASQLESLTGKMDDKLMGLHEQLERTAIDAPRRTLDELTSEGLDALGYVGGR